MADTPDELMTWYQQCRKIAVEAMLDVINHHPYSTSLTPHTPYRASALSGADWVHELLTGHPDRIRCELGMNKRTFKALLGVLNDHGIKSSQRVSLEEQVAIFLYTAVTGLTPKHVGERFRRSTSTITKCFKRILVVLGTPPFYTTYVQLPDIHSFPHSYIQSNPKFSPFFDDALGAISGTHISCLPSTADCNASQNCKGTLPQNCLAACTFDLRFTYMVASWEGSTVDSLYHETRTIDLHVPDGKYYLADAGFTSCDSLLVPYQNVQYDLSEWCHGGAKPSTPEELFNLRHARARNVVEHIFGILKHRFRILQFPPEYDTDIQGHIPAALAALHNFIRHHDPHDIDAYDGQCDPQMGACDTSELGTSPVSSRETERANLRRDRIAQDMWAQYQRMMLSVSSRET